MPILRDNPRLIDTVIADELRGESSCLQSEITLRDLFAAAALAGHPNHLDPDQADVTVAKACYRLADAMLAHRGEGA